MRGALVYKKSHKIKLAYYYIQEADRVADSLVFDSTNPSLLNACA